GLSKLDRSTQRLLGVADLVADPRGLLVLLVLHGLREVAAEPAQALVAPRVGEEAAGHAADVALRVVDLLEQGHELGLEDLVVLRAPEPALRAELLERDAALGAAHVGGRLPLADEALEEARDPARAVREVLLPGAVLAQVEDLLLPVRDLGDVDRGGLVL